jgi:hypothetical protein
MDDIENEGEWREDKSLSRTSNSDNRQSDQAESEPKNHDHTFHTSHVIDKIHSQFFGTKNPKEGILSRLCRDTIGAAPIGLASVKGLKQISGHSS